MALFTSAAGYFEVTAVSFSPNVITVGEETSYSITVKNTSGKKITSMYATIKMYYPTASGKITGSDDYYMYGAEYFEMASISWAAGASKTFTGTFKFTTSSSASYLPNITTRVMPIYKGSQCGFTSAPYADLNFGIMLDFVTNATFSDGTNYDLVCDIRGENNDYLTVIDSRYNPAITKFSAERCTNGTINDEGENIITDLKVALPDNAITDDFAMKFYYARDADATTSSSSIDLTSSITSALTGISDSTTLITRTFDKAADWGLMVVFGDAYESATARIDLARSFANLHLSGHDTGGACFGGFSTSEEGSPKLESHFPIYPYSGIEVVDGGVYEEELPFDSGTKFKVRTDHPLQPTLRCFGHVVELHGEIQPTASISGSTTYYSICTLPEKYAPHHDVIALQQGSNQTIWMLRIFSKDAEENPCKVMFARYRNGDAWATASSTAWLPFHATWII